MSLKVFNFKGLRFLFEEHPMDPLTAALMCLGYFNQFLSTPAGQDFAKINNQLILDIFNILHIHITPPAPKS